MAERILRSPGVTTRELDLSAPGRVTPQGIPAGIIGTAQKGPAFVPINFATANDFKNIFGDTEGKHFGAMAVNEWMRNARSGVYLRVLGAGDTKKSGTYGTNVTTQAGFFSGVEIRDSARLTSSYSTLETDGEADGPVPNPYAASGTPNIITLGTASGWAQKFVGVAERSNIEFKDPSFALSNYDGIYFFVYGLDGANGNVQKHAVFLSSQPVDTNAGPHATERSRNGNTIFDGGVILKDFTADSVNSTQLINLDDKDSNGTGGDPCTSNIEIATAVAAQLAAAGLSNLTIAADTQRTYRVMITSGVVGAITDNTVHTIKSVDNTATVIDLNNSTTSSTDAAGQVRAGVTTVAGGNFTNTISFGEGVPSDESFITIKDEGAAGGTYKLGFKAGGAAFGGCHDVINTTTYANGTDLIGGVFDVVTATSSHDDANGNSATAFGGNAIGQLASGNLRVAMAATSGGSRVLTITQNAKSIANAAPVLAETETNAGAPLGRMYFLGAQMFQDQGNGSDTGVKYFGEGADFNTASANNPIILRGVLMFPSGVIPGVDGGTGVSFDGDAPAAAAYDSYGTGQDGGQSVGWLRAADHDFALILNGFSNSAQPKVLTGSFNQTSPIYFGRVFNTDPSKLQEKGHYLHAHYEIPGKLASVRDSGQSSADAVYLVRGTHDPRTTTSSTAGKFYDTAHVGGSDYKPTYEDWRQKFSHAFTPWIKSQKLGNAKKKLFRFHMLDAGSGGHGLVKASITNISKSTDLSSDFGTFDVLIRSAKDTDMDPVILQQFSGLNLNPSSDRYIARVIGDENTFYDFEQNAGKQKLVTEGFYPNKSQYVRVEMHADVENGSIDATAIPFGFAGKHHLVVDGQSLSRPDTAANVSMKEPPLPMRQTVATGDGTKRVADSRFYWGVQYQNIESVTKQNMSTKTISLVENLTKWFPSTGNWASWVGDNGGAADVSSSVLDADRYNDNEFSLEKVWVACLKNDAVTPVRQTTLAVDPTMWHEAEYIRDGDATGLNGNAAAYKEAVTATTKTEANGYRYLDVSLDLGSKASKKYFKFTVPFQGGWDGLDLFDADKQSMNDLSTFREMDSASSVATLGASDGSTTAAFRKSLDILAEKSDVDIQLLATPGIRSAGVVDYAIDKTEDRFDALYLVDTIAYDHDNKRVNASTQEISVTNTVSKLSSRNLDTSFAAAYFPDLVIQDGSTNVVAPPSVGVLGAMSLNDAVAHPWFAPAGFARGSLATTLETAVKLNRSNMDSLYDADINPITSLPQSGDSVVIFGQKTLLQAQSALDRVNVRRLLIDIRRKVRTVANQILFEPNREATLARFSALVNPILGRVQAQQGLDRYKVVIDTTTTTQQDVENNTIRGKIFLQPTRSIEFISLDFVVTNQGAEI